MIRLNIDGMTCIHCVKAVAEALAAVKGVEGSPQVTLNPGGALVEGSASPEVLIAAVKEAGYQASVES